MQQINKLLFKEIIDIDMKYRAMRIKFKKIKMFRIKSIFKRGLFELDTE